MSGNVLDKHVMGLFARRVGDFVFTLNKEDEGRELLDVNGQAVDEIKYPNLANMLPEKLIIERPPIFSGASSSVTDQRPFLVNNNTEVIHASGTALLKEIISSEAPILKSHRITLSALSSAEDFITALSVSDDGVVIAYTWVDASHSRLYLRVSYDSGASFQSIAFGAYSFWPSNYSLHVSADGNCITAVLWADDYKPSGYEYIKISNPKETGISDIVRKEIYTDHVVNHGVQFSANSYDGGSPIISDDGLNVTLTFGGVLIRTVDGFETSERVPVPQGFSEHSNTSFIINPENQNIIACVNYVLKYASITTDGGESWNIHQEIMSTPEGAEDSDTPRIAPQSQSSGKGDSFWFDRYLVISWGPSIPYHIYLFNEKGEIVSLSKLDHAYLYNYGHISRLFVKFVKDSREVLFIELKANANAGQYALGGLLKSSKVLPKLQGVKVVSDRFVEVPNA